MTRGVVSESASAESDVTAPADPELQVICDVDRIIAGLDYNSFELLPGTVNPRPGMRYIEDIYDDPISDSVEPTEELVDFVTEDTAIEEMAPSMYFLPSPAPYWSPFLLDHRLEGKKKKKNKKKRNKNRQRQLQLQLQLEQDLSPPSTPDISDGSADSPLHSPMQSPPASPEKKAKKKRNKQRRRGSGRARRLSSQHASYPPYEGMNLMSVQLNSMNLSPLSSNGSLYSKPEPHLSYPMRSPHPQGPQSPHSYIGGSGGPMFSRGTPLWIPHPVIYGQC